RNALQTYARLAALDPTDPAPLEAMDTLAVLLSDWRTLIAVLEKKSEVASDEENAVIWRRIAQIKLEMLEEADGAIRAYERALELDPDSAVTVDALIDLLEPKGTAERLVELYARRVDLSDPADAELRYSLQVRAAACHETQLRQPRDAIQ